MLDATADPAAEAYRRLQMDAIVAGGKVVEGLAATSALGFSSHISYATVEWRMVIGIRPAGLMVVILRAGAVECRRTAAVQVESDVALTVMSPDQAMHHTDELALLFRLQENPVLPADRRAFAKTSAEVAGALFRISPGSVASIATAPALGITLASPIRASRSPRPGPDAAPR